MAFKRNGYGQVEPNQLSAQKTGQIYASLPLASDVDILQNGEFMYYDYKSGTVTANGVGEPMLVFNEVKLYEPFWQTSYKDFAMIRVGDNYVTSRLATAGYGDGAETKGVAPNPGHSDWQAGYRMDGIAPRLFKTNVGDIFTTNMVETGDEITYSQGDTLKLKKVPKAADKTGNTLVLSKTGNIDALEFVVAKVYTMPDGQPGLKLQRIK